MLHIASRHPYELLLSILLSFIHLLFVAKNFRNFVVKENVAKHIHKGFLKPGFGESSEGSTRYHSPAKSGDEAM
jgi:hypothetical protein